jgi:hypothetical protein
MNRLLQAGFARLWKDTFFWIAAVFMMIFGAFRPTATYFEMKKYGYYETMENTLFMYVVFMAILVPVFVSLFIGTEYNDGTIRNKLIIGHSRTAIYLSNLIVSVSAGLLICAAYLIIDLPVGFWLLGFFQVDDPMIILKFTGCSFVLCLAISSLCTLASMLRQSRAIASVICILGMFFLLTVAIYIQSSLIHPEYYMDYGDYWEGVSTPDTEDWDESTEPTLIRNPNYIGGNKRKLYQFLQDFLPGGQTITLSVFDTADLGKMSLYSAIITAVSTGAGIYFFRKKDIK